MFTLNVWFKWYILIVKDSQPFSTSELQKWKSGKKKPIVFSKCESWVYIYAERPSCCKLILIFSMVHSRQTHCNVYPASYADLLWHIGLHWSQPVGTLKNITRLCSISLLLPCIFKSILHVYCWCSHLVYLNKHVLLEMWQPNHIRSPSYNWQVYKINTIIQMYFV